MTGSQEVVVALHSHGPMSEDELARHLCVGRLRVCDSLRECKHVRWAMKIKGVWFLLPNGAAQANAIEKAYERSLDRWCRNEP